MRVHTLPDENSALARLAGQVDRIERDVAALASLRIDLDHYGTALQQLIEATRQQVTTVDPTTGEILDADGGWPPEWMGAADPGWAGRWLAELVDWVERVWVEYTPTSVCWPWHPTVVAELFACRESWLGATKSDASFDGLSNWHDRWRPGADARIAKSLLSCSRSDGYHVEGATRWIVDRSALPKLACWWATSRHTGPAPGLTLAGEARR